MVAGTNLGHAKSHNRRVVIEAIRLHGSLSRAEIARITALSGQTASNIVEELEQADFLVAAPSRKPTRGQPAIPYSINPDGAFSIGLQLDNQLLIGILTDLSGKVRASSERRVDGPSPEEAMPLLAAIVDDLLSSFAFERARFLGIGLSMPGPFGIPGKTLIGPPALPGWDDFPITAELQRLTGFPVILENDATAAAIGEKWYGTARDAANFIYLFVGAGLGAGVFLNGQIHHGKNSNAGEIGHVVVVPGGLECSCGARGCLERYVSLLAAYEHFHLASTASPDELLAQDPVALDHWIASTISPLRIAVDMLELLLDPETIVLGGFMPAPILKKMAEQLLSIPSRINSRTARTMPRIVVGATSRKTSVLGAAALPIFSEFSPQFDVLLKRQGGA